MKRGPATKGDCGSATVEQAGLILLIALAVAVGAAIAAGDLGSGPGRGIGVRIANRIACGPLAGGSCRPHPARTAYGEAVAATLKALAPVALLITDREGRHLLPVDFRHCRRPSCAEADRSRPDLDLTVSNRRTTLFTEVGRQDGDLVLTWWGWWPGVGWRSFVRRVADPVAGERPLMKDSPRLVPLEALDGRNHTDFQGEEVPPWQWTVDSDHGSRNP